MSRVEMSLGETIGDREKVSSDPSTSLDLSITQSSLSDAWIALHPLDVSLLELSELLRHLEVSPTDVSL